MVWYKFTFTFHIMELHVMEVTRWKCALSNMAAQLTCLGQRCAHFRPRWWREALPVVSNKNIALLTVSCQREAARAHESFTSDSESSQWSRSAAELWRRAIIKVLICWWVSALVGFACFFVWTENALLTFSVTQARWEANRVYHKLH